jgi:hypothetical protein
VIAALDKLIGRHARRLDQLLLAASCAVPVECRSTARVRKDAAGRCHAIRRSRRRAAHRDVASAPAAPEDDHAHPDELHCHRQALCCRCLDAVAADLRTQAITVADAEAKISASAADARRPTASPRRCDDGAQRGRR